MSMDLWPSTYPAGKDPIYQDASRRNEVDLRQQFLNLIDGTGAEPQRGHWVLLRRMQKRQRCSCWKRIGEGSSKYMDDNRKYDEPNSECIVCGGEGWLYSEELHKVRRRIVTPPHGMAEMEEQEEFAIMNIPHIIYYFKFYVRPTEHDKIIEIDNDGSGNPVRPIVKRNIYNITLSEPFRDLNGRIEYWRCAVRKEELKYGSTK